MSQSCRLLFSNLARISQPQKFFIWSPNQLEHPWVLMVVWLWGTVLCCFAIACDAVSIRSLWWRSMIFPTHFGTLKSSPYARCLEHIPTFGLSYGKCRYIHILYMEPFSKVHAWKKMERIHWSLQHFTATKDLETSRWQPWKGFLLTVVTIARWETCPARIEWVYWLFLLPPMQLAESFALKSVGKKQQFPSPVFWNHEKIPTTMQFEQNPRSKSITSAWWKSWFKPPGKLLPAQHRSVGCWIPNFC